MPWKTTVERTAEYMYMFGIYELIIWAWCWVFHTRISRIEEYNQNHVKIFSKHTFFSLGKKKKKNFRYLIYPYLQKTLWHALGRFCPSRTQPSRKFLSLLLCAVRENDVFFLFYFVFQVTEEHSHYKQTLNSSYITSFPFPLLVKYIYREI